MPIPTPKSGEKEDEYISRCMSVLATEYDDESQRYAVCIGKYEDKQGLSLIKHQYAKKNNGAGLMEAIKNIRLKFAGEKVSIDFDDTLSTDRGKALAKRLLADGVDLHIITRRQEATASAEVYKVAEEVGIPKAKVHFTNGKLKWELIKRLGITKHIDNNPDEIAAIRKNVPNVKAQKFSEISI